jgi:glycosyltransferase involved in cell wall biosynthesis
MIKLAIIIPYYKPQFFREALLSIKNQTDQRFRLYVGDDCSPYNPDEILRDIFGDNFTNKLSLYRFNENLGTISLTKQWERCIEQSTEEYIWLFSDDDLMPADAVERFYCFLEKNLQSDLVRFNLSMIDDEGTIINSGVKHPAYETSEEFLKRRLRGECISAACEYIFKKDVYIKKGGFVDLPLALASDDATWINFGENNGIYTIQGNPVSWRFGNFSISANNMHYKLKIKAAMLFIKYIRSRYSIDINVQLQWLFFKLALLNKSIIGKTYFLYELYNSGMFSVAEVFLFIKFKIVKKLFRRNKLHLPIISL